MPLMRKRHRQKGTVSPLQQTSTGNRDFKAYNGGRRVRMERVWAMPSRWTFTIKPIAKLIREEMNGGTWLDPMAGFNSPAHIRNDINPEAPAEYHLDALEFLEQQPADSVDGLLWDPPYSYEMAKRKYKVEYKCTRSFATYARKCKQQLGRILKAGGKAISFGWNSQGLGKNPYYAVAGRKAADNQYHGKLPPFFKIYRILLVAHGFNRPDTIVTCQQRVQTTLLREMKDSDQLTGRDPG
jgi:hypothetical protein